MDFLWATLFLLWCEALSLPLRFAMSGWRAPADVRRMFSRLAGLPLLVLPVWFAAHGAEGLLARGAGIAWFGLAAAAGLFVGLTKTRSAARLLAYEGEGRAKRRQVALDGLMLALFFGFVAFRRWVPEMTTYELDSSAAEKFANAMIFWTSWNSRHLPPEDYWLAGNPLPYYYWGHFQWAYLARMGGFPAAMALNLAFAASVTSTWISAHLLGRAMRLPRGWAAGAALCAAWAGNPASLAHLTSWWQGGFHWSAYDYWGPSRAIANVVDEFPAFSAILGDFHAHHLSLPFITGWFALSAGRWRGDGRGASGIVWGLVWTSLCLAAVFSNLWNLPLVGLGLVATLGLSAWGDGRRLDVRKLLIPLAWVALIGVGLAVGMRLLRSGAPLPLPEGPPDGLLARLHLRRLPPELRSSLASLFGMWGFPALALGVGAVGRGLARAREQSAAGGGAGRWRELGLSLAGAILIFAHLTPLGSKLPGGTGLACLGVALWIVALASGPKPWLPRPAAALALGGAAVLAGLEVLYMPDRYVGELARYNSYFKFSYPVWPVLWGAAWVSAWRLWRARLAAPVRIPLGLALVLVLFGASVYTARAIPARVVNSCAGDQPPREPTLDAFGFAGHRAFSAPEAPLLDFIRQKVPAGDRIAEAGWTGTDEAMAYKYQGRIASLTGRPVPIGWAHHEQQWRGPAGYRRIDRRIALVNALYRSSTPEELRRRANALNVQWVVFGVLEARVYGVEVLETLKRALPIAAEFSTGGSGVYLFRAVESD